MRVRFHPPGLCLCAIALPGGASVFANTSAVLFSGSWVDMYVRARAFMWLSVMLPDASVFMRSSVDMDNCCDIYPLSQSSCLLYSISCIYSAVSRAGNQMVKADMSCTGFLHPTCLHMCIQCQLLLPCDCVCLASISRILAQFIGHLCTG